MLLYPWRRVYAGQRVNWDFYEPKTMHDSSLSAAIHSIVANDIDQAEEAYAYFKKQLASIHQQHGKYPCWAARCFARGCW